MYSTFADVRNKGYKPYRYNTIHFNNIVFPNRGTFLNVHHFIAMALLCSILPLLIHIAIKSAELADI